MINFPDGAESKPSRADDELAKEVKPFRDLRTAGRELAIKLERYRRSDRPIIIAIALGGVPVADEVGRHLGAPLDLLLIRRLLAPQGPGAPTCAVNVGGLMIIDEGLRPPAAPSTPLEYFLAEAIAELGRRERTCRRGLPPIDLAGRTVILVDCGIRSGATMLAAIGALRKTRPAQIIVAVPAASVGGAATVAALVDEFVCLVQPNPFGNVAVWYKDFGRPDDDGVGELVSSE